MQPSPWAVQERFNVWSQAVENWGMWTLDEITEFIYIISCHVHDHQEKLLVKGERVSTNSKIILLVLMYSFFIIKIDQSSWSCPPIAEQGRSNESPTAAAEAEVNKATSTKLPIRCKQCMHFMFVLMKRISLSPNHSPQTSTIPNPRRPDWLLAELICSPNLSPSIKSLLDVPWIPSGQGQVQ